MRVTEPGQSKALIQGFTLVELVVFIIVLAVGIVGVTIVINRVVLQSPEALIQTRAMEITQAYLDEILARRFDANTGQGGLPRCDSSDPGAKTCTASGSFGPDPGETGRPLFNDVDDYHGLTSNPPEDAFGNPLPRYDDFSVTVSVSYAGTELALADNRRAKRITVQVTTPLGNSIPVSAYRLNF